MTLFKKIAFLLVASYAFSGTVPILSSEKPEKPSSITEKGRSPASGIEEGGHSQSKSKRKKQAEQTGKEKEKRQRHSQESSSEQSEVSSSTEQSSRDSKGKKGATPSQGTTHADVASGSSSSLNQAPQVAPALGCNLCGIPAGHKCDDSRVYKNSLDYTFHVAEENEDVDVHTDHWHVEKLGALRNLYEALPPASKKHNYALGALLFVYKEPGEHGAIKQALFDLPPLFVSQEYSEIKKVMGMNVYGLGESMNVASAKGLERQEVTNAFKRHILQILNPASAHNSRLDGGYLEDRYRSAGHLTPQSYFHSEQALLLYLIHHDNIWLDWMRQHIPEHSKIYQVAIQVMSDRDMCRECSVTYFRLLENSGGILEAWKDKIRSHFETAEDLKFLVQVSGDPESRKDDKHYQHPRDNTYQRILNRSHHRLHVPCETHVILKR